VRLALGEAYVAKPESNTALNAKHQGAAKPKPDWAHVARTWLSLSEASRVCGTPNLQKLLGIVA